MRYQGKISSWKDDQGFGFVNPDDGGERAFLHISAFSNASRRPVSGEVITYAVTVDDKRRLRASDVMFASDKGRTNSSSGPTSRGLTVPGLFFCFLMFAVLIKQLTAAVLVAYIVASIVTYFYYAIDKSAAMNNRWRTPESTLHVLAFIGGWPGAMLAQNIMRHKSKKKEFRTVFWFTVVANCGALGWLFTSRGNEFLKSFANLIV